MPALSPRASRALGSTLISTLNAPIARLLLLLGLASAANAAVTTLIDYTGVGTSSLVPYIGGTGGDLAAGEVVGMKWTQTVSYTNVAISVSVRAIDINHPNVTAILTTNVGPTATAADVIATKTVNVFNFFASPVYPMVTFFTGLSLPAGTYYLMMVGDANATQGTQNVNDLTGNPVLDPGITLELADNQFTAVASIGATSINAAFVPGSTFFFYGRDENSGRLAVKITSGALPPTIQKQFSTPTVSLGSNTALTFTLTNPNSTAATGIAFTDTMPAGLNALTVSSVCIGGSSSLVANQYTLTGGTLAPGATCTIGFTIAATSAGMKNNVSGTVSSTDGGTGGAASASINVIAGPQITKTFGASSVPVGGPTSLTFTITNPNTIPIPGLNFIDILPVGLNVSNPNGLTGICGGGTITAPATGSSINLSGGTLGAGANCTFSVSVTGTTAGSKLNSVTASAVETGSGNTSNATLLVMAPSSISKGFGSPRINVGTGTTALTFNLANPNGVPLTGVGFNDVLPSGLVVATPNGLTGSCGGGSISAIAGGASISLTGSTIPSNGFCIFSVNVRATTDGLKSNLTTNVSSTEGGAGNQATATINAYLPPSITKTFSSSSIPLNGITTLTFAISNTNTSQSLTGISFADTLPPGLVVANPSVLTIDCPNGAVAAPIALGVVSLSGLSLTGGASCSIGVNVTATSLGLKQNAVTISAFETGTGNTSNASLTVAMSPSISKIFGASKLNVGSSTTLSFSIQNPNAATLNGVSFSDTLQGGLTVATPNGLTGSCGAGTITATAGSTSISLANGVIAANSTCTFSINITATADGLISNITTSVDSTEGGTGNQAQATINAYRPPAITKAFGSSTIPLNTNTTLSFTISNPDTNQTLTGVSFTDTLTAGLVVATPNGLSTTCPNGTITAVAGSSSVALSGLSLNASLNCVITVNVTGNSSGLKQNSVTISATDPGTGNTSQANLSVVGPPLISKAFGVSKLNVGGTTSLTFSIKNPNAVTLNGVSFSDTLPGGLIVSTPNSLQSTCGGTATATAGSTSISLTNGTVAAGLTCVLSLNVTAPADGIILNTTTNVTSTEGGNGNQAAASLTIARPPAVTKAFSAVAIPLGTTATLTFSVTNPNVNVTLTGITFSDTLPAGLVVATPNGLTGACGGSTITATAGGSLVSFSGATLAPGVSCTFAVNVTGTTEGTKLNTTSAITSTQAVDGDPATASLLVGAAFQLRYAANLASGDSEFNFTNNGASCANICVNVYAFSPDEQLISCCTCTVTPNGLASISAKQDLLTNTLTPAVPGSVVVKLLATTGGPCAANAPGPLAPGLAAWRSTIHALDAGFGMTETPFTAATLSATELSRISAYCGFITANGSGFGVCKSCRSGALGGAKK